MGEDRKRIEKGYALIRQVASGRHQGRSDVSLWFQMTAWSQRMLQMGRAELDSSVSPFPSSVKTYLISKDVPTSRHRMDRLI